MKFKLQICILAIGLAAAGCGAGSTNTPAKENSMNTNNKFPFQLTEDEWRKRLTPEQYHVLREAGTERPFTGQYWETKTPGEYDCAACGALLFKSDDKFDSHCGWPSFSEVAAQGHVIERRDTSYGMIRTEVLCANCGSLPRERALMYVIENFCPNWRELTIHESSPAPRGASAFRGLPGGLTLY